MSVENYFTKKEKIEKCYIKIENLEKEENDLLRAFDLIKSSLFYMRLFYALQGLLIICVLINASLINPFSFFSLLIIIGLSVAALIDAHCQFEKAKGCDYEVKSVIKNIFILKSKSINNYYEKILKTKNKIKSAENELKTLNNNLVEIKNHLSSSSFEDYLESTFFDKDKFKIIEELINEKVAEKEEDIYARKKLINHSISKLKDLEETYETIKNY